MVIKFAQAFYKEHGIKKNAKLSPEALEAERQREAKEKEERTQEALTKLDASVKDINMNVAVNLTKIGVNIAPTQETRALEVGMENYSVRITKKKTELKLNAGGFTVASFFSFRKLYDVAMEDMKKVKQYIADQTTRKDYGQYI